MRLEIVRKMRDAAQKGAKVRELAKIVSDDLNLSPGACIPIMNYFQAAFLLSVREAMPLREWIGTTQDDAINTKMMPLIEEYMKEWMSREEEE